MNSYLLRFQQIPKPGMGERLLAFLAGLEPPFGLELEGTPGGLRVRLYVEGEMPPGLGALTRDWFSAAPEGPVLRPLPEEAWVFAPRTWPLVDPPAHDLMLGFGAELIRWGGRLQAWVLSRDAALHARLRRAHLQPTASHGALGNPWEGQLRVVRLAQAVLLLPAAVGLGLIALAHDLAAGLAFIGGSVLAGAAAAGPLRELEAMAAVPPEMVRAHLDEVPVRCVLVYCGPDAQAGPPALPLPVEGRFRRERLPARPGELGRGYPVFPTTLARLFGPAEAGSAGTILAEESRQDVPAPAPSAAYRPGPGKVVIGRAVADGSEVAVAPAAHGVILGASRSGKSSLAYRMILSLMESPEPPGLFLIDPHSSLAAAVLAEVGRRRPELISRLVVVLPDRPEVLPLNLLCHESADEAADLLIQIGRRLWGEYWGPRMQSVWVALLRIAWAANRHLAGAKLGLYHIPELGGRERLRRAALDRMPPQERSLLEAELNQILAAEAGEGRAVIWQTEVLSPIISKTMELRNSPWLFAALHTPGFWPLKELIREQAWFVVVPDAGIIGREASRLLAAVTYNLVQATYRRVVTEGQTLPYWVFVDEVQEVGAALRLEEALSGMAKFGYWVWALPQSIAAMEREDGLRAVAQGLKDNTSVQVVFSPGPDDQGLIQRMLGTELRYGPITYDLPALEALVRARLGGRWQPPVLVRTEPMPPADGRLFGEARAVADEAVRRRPELYQAPPRVLPARLVLEALEEEEEYWARKLGLELPNP